MFDRYFSLLHEFIQSHKRVVLIAVVLMTVLAAIGLHFITFESTIDVMLPHEQGIHRSIRFLRDSKLSDKVVVSLSLTSSDKGRKELIRAVDQLAASLNPPLVSAVTTGVSLPGIMDDDFFFAYAPQVLDQHDLARIDGWINEDGVSTRLQAIYRQMLRPEGIFMGSLSRSDPLGIRMLLLGKMKKLSAASGYDVTVDNGYFLSLDGGHALMILETPILMTDGPGCRKLVAYLKEKVEVLPDIVSADFVGGHFHTVSNENVIKRDIGLAITVASIAFLLLFMGVFRDPRIILVFLIPLVAVMLSINLSTFLVGPLSYLVIGLGTVIAGISVDYGIHVYIAARRGGNVPLAIRHAAKFLSVCALTTIISFSVLFFSQVQGYHQLSFFSILSVIISVILAFFVLPHALSWQQASFIFHPAMTDRLERLYSPKRVQVIVWALLTIAASFFAVQVRFDVDITRLDGSEPAVFKAEENFYNVWGGQRGDQAIFVATGATFEEALEKNESIYREAKRAIGEDRFSSLSMVLPSDATREKNRKRWNRFWKSGREERLSKLIRNIGPRYQFTDRAFSPFFDNLTAPGNSRKADTILAHFRKQFVQKRADGYQILSFFPDTREDSDTMSAISERYPGTFLVSRRALSKAISDVTAREVKLLASIALLFVAVLILVFFRSFAETLIALTPVVTSILWLFAFMTVFGLTLNVVNMVAGIVTIGLVLDYGIGMTYEYRHDMKAGTIIAVSLSALTTLIGTGVLLVADHPALFSIGVTLVISISAGYLTSILVVPSLCSYVLPFRQNG